MDMFTIWCSRMLCDVFPMFKQGGDLLFFHKVNSMTAILPSASPLLSLAQLKYSFQKTSFFSSEKNLPFF